VFKRSKLPILKKLYLYSLDDIYILNILFLPLTLIYLMIFLLKKYLQSNNKINSVPVVVVGNLIVGGTGKTSLVIWLCNYFSSRKYNIGVISGGYKTNRPYDLEIVNRSSLAENVGDEAMLIMEKTSSIVCKCKDRRLAYEYLVSKFDLDIVISDDGLTHFKLNRDLEIIISREYKPFGNSLLLPAGPLRQLPSSINKYENIIFNKLKSSKSRGFYYEISKIISCNNQIEKNISDLKDENVHLVTAIANPGFLIKNLEDLGINVYPRIYPDHHLIDIQDLTFNDDKVILMTEKDFVKCKKFNLKNAFYIPTKIVVDYDIKIMLNERISNLLKV